MNHLVANVVVVGDSQCGKTSLLRTFYKTQRLGEDVPTFDDYVTLGMVVDDGSVGLELRDTVSSEACRRFRLFWYMGSHVILLCFSVDCPVSLRNVPDDWMPELRRICPDVPVILVGNKKDVRDRKVPADEEPSNGSRDPDNDVFVSAKDGRTMSANICAKAYVECSALTGEGVQYLFEVAARAGLEKLKKHSTAKCVLL